MRNVIILMSIFKIVNQSLPFIMYYVNDAWAKPLSQMLFLTFNIQGDQTKYTQCLI